MFNWNHMNQGDLQNWFNLPPFNPWQAMSGATGAGDSPNWANQPFFNPWQAMGGQGAPFGSNSAGFQPPYDFFERYAKQWQGQPSFDWAQMAQSGFNPLFFNSAELTDFIKTLNVADDKLVRSHLQNICDQWFMQAKQMMGLTEPAWLDSQRTFLQSMSEGLRMQPSPPKHLQGVADFWRNAVETQESCLRSMSDLMACFDDLQQDVRKQFMKNIEKAKEINSVDQLFSIWTASFEACYNNVVLTGDFQKAFAKFVEDISQMRLLFQKATDEQVEKLGLPSHREMDTALRRLSEVRTQTRELTKQVEALRQKADSAANYDDRLSALEKEIRDLKASSAADATKKPATKTAAARATKKPVAKTTNARSKK